MVEKYILATVHTHEHARATLLSYINIINGKH